MILTGRTVKRDSMSPAEQNESRSDENINSEMEDLRQYYITPAYLSVLSERVRNWADDLIAHQLLLFKKTIPDYPEVLEILEGELYRRELNSLKKRIKKLTSKELKSLNRKFSDHADSFEIVQTELFIREGKKILPES